MQKLTGTIHYKLFAEGTKSESQPDSEEEVSEGES